MAKQPPRLVRAADQQYTPRFEYGDQAQVAVVCGPEDGTALGTGLVRMENARIPWTIQYDEVVLVLDGQLTIQTAMGDLTAGPHDSIWLPTGTDLTYVAEHALVFYAIHPANWADQGATS